MYQVHVPSSQSIRRSLFSDSTYSESKSLSFDAPPDVKWVERYDYESDSDLGHLSNDEMSRPNVSSPGAHLIFLKNKQVLATSRLQCTRTRLNTSSGDGDSAISSHQNGSSSPSCTGERAGKVICVQDTAYVTSVAHHYLLL